MLIKFVDNYVAKDNSASLLLLFLFFNKVKTDDD